MTASIVVTIHNKAHYLPFFLDALVASAPGAEFVLIDDGSTDGTDRILARYPGIRLTTPDLWETRANNVGLGIAGGDPVAIVQDDDLILSPGWLDRAAQAMREFGLDLLCGRGFAAQWRRIGDTGPAPDDAPTPHARRSRRRLDRPFGRFEERQQHLIVPEVRDGRLRVPVVESDIAIRSPLILSRRLIDQVGLFDAAYAPLGFDDYDLAFRARRAGLRVGATIIPQLGRFMAGSRWLHQDPAKLAWLHACLDRNLDRFLDRWHLDFPEAAPDWSAPQPLGWIEVEVDEALGAAAVALMQTAADDGAKTAPSER